eukprot:13175979-Ditylum_brightwellii.AAC.1
MVDPRRRRWWPWQNAPGTCCVQARRCSVHWHIQRQANWPCPLQHALRHLFKGLLALLVDVSIFRTKNT